MLSTDKIIDEVLRTLKEPTTNSHWPRDVILGRLNICADELALEIPDLLRVWDTSLTTVANQAEYQIPANIGKIYQVEINGSVVEHRSYDALAQDSIRGEISEYWESEVDEPDYWYLKNDKLCFWPKCATGGKTITIAGELLLTAMTDSAANYPFENIAYLRKAQKIIIYKTAKWCAMEDENFNLYAILDKEDDRLTDVLRNDWMVLREVSPQSMLFNQQTEDEPQVYIVHTR